MIKRKISDKMLDIDVAYEEIYYDDDIEVLCCDGEQKQDFFIDLPHPLAPGHCIEVRGTPWKSCNRFAVNLLCSRDPQSDIVFHFNPRLDMKYVVRNTKQKGYWNKEETASPNSFPFERNIPFNILILITKDKFMISVNDEHFCHFTYRIPFQKIKYLEGKGQVKIDNVDFKQLRLYPKNLPELTKIYQIPFQDSTDNKEHSLKNPFIGHLPEGLQIGWVLELQGKVKLLPHSFLINLQNGHQYWPHPAIPLHMNPRFNALHNSHSLIMNSWQNGDWGQEEISNLPFTPGENFRLNIQVDHDKFIIWVNNKVVTEFKFRVDHHKMNTVFIQGDLHLDQVFVSKTYKQLLQKNSNDLIDFN